ncbi:MAG: hypothetical protein MJ236_05560 [Clostridia bacterium]|nr:hypothetical protein [Clostridia bacterium]
MTTATTDTVQTSVTTTAVSTIATTVTAVETTAVSTTQQTTAESSSITDESTEILSTIITSETSVPSQTTTIKGTESIIDEWNNQKEELKHTFGCSSLLTGGSIVLTAIVVCLSLVATKKRED